MPTLVSTAQPVWESVLPFSHKEGSAGQVWKPAFRSGGFGLTCRCNIFIGKRESSSPFRIAEGLLGMTLTWRTGGVGAASAYKALIRKEAPGRYGNLPSGAEDWFDLQMQYFHWKTGVLVAFLSVQGLLGMMLWYEPGRQSRLQFFKIPAIDQPRILLL